MEKLLDKKTVKRKNKNSNSLLKKISNPEHELDPLIELGAQGYFPLFYPEWINISMHIEKNKKKSPTLSEMERTKIKNITNRINKHKNIDRKKTVLLSINQTDRNLFIKAFFLMVESYILDTKPSVQ